MSRPLILLAHGAGAGSAHPFMQGWARRLGAIGRVVCLDYPYVLEGRKAPDRLPKLVAAHREALREARKRHRGPVLLAGKSMGSRVGCHLANELTDDEAIDGLVCFGYPLKGMGKQAVLRDAVLLALRQPILFIQGTRDNLCPLDLLEAVRAKMTAASALHVVEDGNHSLEVAKRTLRAADETQEEVDARILEAIRAFMAPLV